MRCFLPTVRVFGNFPARTYAWTVWTFRWSASATSRVVYRWGRSGMGGDDLLGGRVRDGEDLVDLHVAGHAVAAGGVRGGGECEEQAQRTGCDQCREGEAEAGDVRHGSSPPFG